MWAPDGKSLAYITDRNGVPNVFLYDFGNREHYQLTNVAGGVSGITEFSPALTWARAADRLAFVHFEKKGEYTVWTVENPRALKKEPYRAPCGADDDGCVCGGNSGVSDHCGAKCAGTQRRRQASNGRCRSRRTGRRATHGAWSADGEQCRRRSHQAPTPPALPANTSTTGDRWRRCTLRPDV